MSYAWLSLIYIERAVIPHPLKIYFVYLFDLNFIAQTLLLFPWSPLKSPFLLYPFIVSSLKTPESPQFNFLLFQPLNRFLVSTSIVPLILLKMYDNLWWIFLKSSCVHFVLCLMLIFTLSLARFVRSTSNRQLKYPVITTSIFH